MPDSSEYEPAFGATPVDDAAADDLARVRQAFELASQPYLSTPVSWFAWAVLLPLAALTSARAAAIAGPRGLVLLWSLTILVGGLIEGRAMLAARRQGRRSPLGGWAMALQGNLSAVGAALSAALVALDAARLLPGLWLLLLGHSFFALGGLALPAMRRAGLLYQLGGVAALLPGLPTAAIFAASTALGNLWIGLAVAARRRRARQVASSGSSS